ncbi:MAG: prepilin-type N-terminal cleavage/methylation domain-containing protein [bacterium]|nr:prepilin-type N-terminal cleavage/methylation domain-containing protein [bacterium]
MRYQEKNSGFSLIELMVAGSIFILVLGFVGGIFSMFVSRQKQQVDTQLLQQEVQNFLEVIERDVRTAYGEKFNDPNASSNQSISFMNQEQKFTLPVSERVEHQYSLKTDMVENWIGRVYYNDGSGSLSMPIPITSDKINVTNLEFKWNKGKFATDSSGNHYLTGVPLRLTIALEVCRRDDLTSCLQTQATIASRQTKPIDEK